MAPYRNWERYGRHLVGAGGGTSLLPSGANQQLGERRGGG